MIDSIAGVILSRGDEAVVIDVQGIGFRLDVPASTTQAVGAVGAPARLLARLSFNTNEGTFQLFGFATESERECFDILTSINGIGPRKALGILSQIEIAKFARAILTNDLKYLASIKGVGKKTAERLVVELREKMAAYGAGESAATPGAPAGPVLLGGVKDAYDALVVLGCRPVIAEKAVAEAVKLLGEKAPTEDLVRAALKFRS